MKALRRAGDRELRNDRILGSGEFVEQIIKETEGKVKYQLPVKDRTPETSLRQLPDFNSFIDTLALLHNLLMSLSII